MRPQILLTFAALLFIFDQIMGVSMDTAAAMPDGRIRLLRRSPSPNTMVSNGWIRMMKRSPSPYMASWTQQSRLFRRQLEERLERENEMREDDGEDGWMEYFPSDRLFDRSFPVTV